MKKKVLFALLAMVLAFGLALPVAAHTEDNPQVTTLYAGQDTDVGTVSVWNDGNNLYVKYETSGGWEIMETHLYVGKNAPPTSAPGQFPYDDDDATSMTATVVIYEIPLAEIDSYSMKTNKKGKSTGVMIADGDPGVDPCDYVYIAAHAAIERTFGCEDPVVLLATENNHPAVSDTEMEARIWSITTSGAAALISNIPAPVRVAETDNFNGNAFDAENGRFYFSDYGKFGGSYYMGPSPLYFNDLEGNQTYAGDLEAGASGATFYDGDYYYIGERTDDLRKVTFHVDGTIDDEQIVATIFPGTNKVLAFGDIDIRDEDGSDVLYGSATEIPGYLVVFFSMNLDGTGYNVIKTGALYGAGGTQIAFGSDGVLYGVNARKPFELFSIDPANGDTTFIAEMPVGFADLASGPVCEPEKEDETAWADGSDFPGKNWATYFKYQVQRGITPSDNLSIMGTGWKSVTAWCPCGPDYDLTYTGEPIALQGWVDLSGAAVANTGDWSKYYAKFCIIDSNGYSVDVVFGNDWLGSWYEMDAQQWDRIRMENNMSLAQPEQHYATVGGTLGYDMDGYWVGAGNGATVYPSDGNYFFQLIVDPVAKTFTLQVYGMGSSAPSADPPASAKPGWPKQNMYDYPTWLELGTITATGFDFSEVNICATLWASTQAEAADTTTIYWDGMGLGTPLTFDEEPG